jgi:pSer/pThr/pTyr-binding forkhead associated (FHA) protein
MQLDVFDGDLRVDTLTLDKDTTVLGRALDVDVRIEHASTSRKHCEIVRDASGGYFLVDLKSSQGTHLNGSKIAPNELIKLTDGAQIRLGASARVYKVILPDTGISARAAAEAEERVARERYEMERLAYERERADRDRLDRDRYEQERIERDRQDRERQEAIERERYTRERAEQERFEREREDRDRLDRERYEFDRQRSDRDRMDRMIREPPISSLADTRDARKSMGYERDPYAYPAAPVAPAYSVRDAPPPTATASRPAASDFHLARSICAPALSLLPTRPRARRSPCGPRKRPPCMTALPSLRPCDPRHLVSHAPTRSPRTRPSPIRAGSAACAREQSVSSVPKLNMGSVPQETITTKVGAIGQVVQDEGHSKAEKVYASPRSTTPFKKGSVHAVREQIEQKL